MSQPNRQKFESIFNFMKTKGLFTQYKDYDDYCRQTEPAKDGPNIEEGIKNQIVKNELPKEEERFEDTLTGKDREDFLKMFGD